MSKVIEDVTIGVIRGMDWVTLAPYANSLARCGFKGVRVMFVEDEPEEVVQNLNKLGFVVIPRKTSAYSKNDNHRPEYLAYGYRRFEPVIEFLKKNTFRYVIWTDTRDVVFQSDPVPYLETMFPAQIAFAGLGHISLGCKYNDRWIWEASLDSAIHEEVRRQETLACGTFAGVHEVMLDLIQDMYEGCLDHPCTDQGMFNCLIRTSPYKEITHVPAVDEPFSAQWWPARRANLAQFKMSPLHSPERDPIFDESTGEVRTWDGELYSMVHLYDRSPKWVKIMQEKYI